jgi:hypothetical protein
MMKRIVAIFMSAALCWTGLTLPAMASVIDTQQVMSMDARQAQISRLQAQLARDDVRQGLIALGVDPNDAIGRVSALSDQELAQLQGQLDSLPSGGGVLVLVGAVFVVLMILEFTGVIDIFKHG